MGYTPASCFISQIVHLYHVSEIQNYNIKECVKKKKTREKNSSYFCRSFIVEHGNGAVLNVESCFRKSGELLDTGLNGT